MAGKSVSLSEGTFYINAEVALDQANVRLHGANYQATIIQAQTAMTNSLLISGSYCDVENLQLSGNSNATQMRLAASYCNLRRVYSTGHSTYNLFHDSGNINVVDKCFFLGKVVKSTRGALRYQNCYFNGQGGNKCLIIDGSQINVIGCILETYTTYCIDVAQNGGSLAINIIGNYFESANSVTAVINAAAASPGETDYCTIIGNHVDATVAPTNSVLIGQRMRGWLINSNSFPNGILINTAAASVNDCDIECYQGITFNGLSIGTRLIATNSKRVYYNTGAPGSGTWGVGDHVINTTPAAGGAPGWFCTTAGTPGTWKAESNLAA